MAKTVKTVDEMIAAFGGLKRTAAVLHTTVESVRQFRTFGLPCTHFLTFYLGLELRGYTAAPELFGVRRWQDLPGA